MSVAEVPARIERDGYAVVPDALAGVQVDDLRHAVGRIGTDAGVYSRGEVYAARGLLERIPAVAELARSPESDALVAPILGPSWRPVRAIYFDKTPAANWKVPWHQDLTIAVREKPEITGFGPWSIKAGVNHVQPPVEILEQMLAVRFALDDNGPENGPVRVLSGTHKLGRLSAVQIARLRQECDEALCCVPGGGALLMRPLLLHASSPMVSGSSRRVIHIEYAGCGLPDGLEWYS